MDNNQILDDILTKIKKSIINYDSPSFNRTYIEIKAKDIISVSDILFNQYNARFITASGFDNIKDMQIFYHFAFDKNNLIITLKVILKINNPEIDSISNLFPAAIWIEREMRELLGIEFKGLKETKHLLLPDNWPKNNFPLKHEVLDD